MKDPHQDNFLKLYFILLLLHAQKYKKGWQDTKQKEKNKMPEKHKLIDQKEWLKNSSIKTKQY